MGFLFTAAVGFLFTVTLAFLFTMTLGFQLTMSKELRSIKIGQLLAPQGTVYQTTPGTGAARNFLKMLKIDSLPSVLAVE